MYEPPLTVSDPQPVPRRKRGFWFWSIWASLASVVVGPILCTMGTMLAMNHALMSGTGKPGTLPTDEAVDAMHYGVSAALFLTVAGVILAALALVWLIVSVIRFLTLPKTVS